MASIVLGGGCFWCLDAVYKQVKGVAKIESGYAGGHETAPTYDKVCAGGTGHAEVVRLTFNQEVIPESVVLDIFWSIHDPTSLDKQGADQGPMYRSIILYSDEAQKQRAQASRDQAQQLWDEPIVTEIKPLDHFYMAEDYHQDYFANNPELTYCQIVINPKLHKLRQQFKSWLA